MPEQKPDTSPLVDSHAHINMPEFDSDREDVIAGAFDEGIAALLCPAEVSDPRNLAVAMELAERHPRLIAAAGVHPHEARFFTDRHAGEIEKLAARGAIHAVGEIGLDFHYDLSPRERQVEAFREQLRLAARLDLPVIIHSRSAARETASVIAETDFTRGGVFHCFTEDRTFAEQMLERGFFISFSGVLTFPGAEGIRDAARGVPLDRILVETDSPYLTPVPFRGKIRRNEPKYVRITAQYLADLKGIPLALLAGESNINFQRLFQFEIPPF